MVEAVTWAYTIHYNSSNYFKSVLLCIYLEKFSVSFEGYQNSKYSLMLAP